jgi:hypothetical protein
MSGSCTSPGVHLQLLTGLARTPSAPLRKLADHLTHLRSDGATEGRWYDAATLLDTAHDLIATHLEDGLLPRTPQAEERLTQPAAVRASRHIAELVLDAVTTRQQLFRSALLSQRRLPRSERPISKSQTHHLTTTTTTIEVYVMAALWGLDHRADSPGHDLLSEMVPAAVMAPAARSATFTGSLEALEVLRQLVYTQARGAALASPASLRDLALLGARFTASTDSLPVPQTGLERVEHAHALDTLETAHTAWVTASRDLTTTVQGLTKAPEVYGATIRHLLQSDPSDKVHQTAVFAALPRLGREASHAITALGRSGDLLAPQRDLHLRRTWTALPDEAVAKLLEAGLACRTRRNTLVDRLRDRITFGISNLEGELVGFTARRGPSAPATVPKYLNSPTTAVYKKGEAPFGLGEQHARIRAGAVPVLVEGPYDVVAVQIVPQENEEEFAPITRLDNLAGHHIY